MCFWDEIKTLGGFCSPVLLLQLQSSLLGQVVFLSSFASYCLRGILLCRLVFVTFAYGVVGWLLSPCDIPPHRILHFRVLLHPRLIHCGIMVFQDVSSLSFLKLSEDNHRFQNLIFRCLMGELL